VEAKDTSGFIVNRLLVPYMLDAIRCLEQGLASTEDIDKGMTLGTGYPMGPFTLCDFVGIDTLYYIAEIMFEEFREPRFAPPPLLKRMVTLGLLRPQDEARLLRLLGREARPRRPRHLSRRRPRPRRRTAFLRRRSRRLLHNQPCGDVCRED
jgi:3-hydroxyacyl-CoA dehydrogenase